MKNKAKNEELSRIQRDREADQALITEFINTKSIKDQYRYYLSTQDTKRRPMMLPIIFPNPRDIFIKFRGAWLYAFRSHDEKGYVANLFGRWIFFPCFAIARGAPHWMAQDALKSLDKTRPNQFKINIAKSMEKEKDLLELLKAHLSDDFYIVHLPWSGRGKRMGDIVMSKNPDVNLSHIRFNPFIIDVSIELLNTNIFGKNLYISKRNRLSSSLHRRSIRYKTLLFIAYSTNPPWNATTLEDDIRFIPITTDIIETVFSTHGHEYICNMPMRKANDHSDCMSMSDFASKIKELKPRDKKV